MIGSLVVALLLYGPAAAEEKAAPRKPAAKAAPAPAPLKVPPDARRVEAGTWSHTDAQGKRWIYRETPFGIARSEDRPAAAGQTPFGKVEAAAADRSAESAVPAAGAAIDVREDGESLRFSREGPFGTYKWTKKKNELNAEEQRAWKRERERAAESREAKPE